MQHQSVHGADMAAAISSNDCARALFKKHSCQIVQRNAKQQVNGPDGRTLNVPVRGTDSRTQMPTQ